MLTTNEILAGLGLVVVLAIACRIVAERFRLPAIVLLLPVGFLAGAITADVRPEALFGDAFQPLVSLGVGLILFEAGLRLKIDELERSVRRVVVRLISVGTLVTFAAITGATKLIFGFSWGVSGVIGALLVVSGPTVVLPLLSFVRPSDRVRSVLKWEGTLIDPIGALLGVVVLDAVAQGAAGDRPFHPGILFSSLAVGFAVGVIGALVLRLLLRHSQRVTPELAVGVSLMAVTAVVVGADLARDDAGLVAAAVLGIAVAQDSEIEASRILEFHGTVVELLIGILFVLISASVTPSAAEGVLWRSLGLVAVMVVLVRPLVVAVGTWRSHLNWRERAFAAWMAPRGIVAAATASAFSLSLTQTGIENADQILPVAFVVVFSTVVLYGLTAQPVSRLLDVAGEGAPVVLVVGGEDWGRAVGRALAAAGVRVRLWTSREAERAAAREAGLQAEATPLGVDVENLETELEEVSDALVMSASDDFNALAAFELGRELGRDSVYRLVPGDHSDGDAAGGAEGRLLFGDGLTYEELARRLEAGAKLVERPGDGAGEGGLTPLFALDGDGALRVLAAGEERPAAAVDERLICLDG